jgi:ABC-type transport system involved in Fe-S cluster assembly fused permease/ATPase subunit
MKADLQKPNGNVLTLFQSSKSTLVSNLFRLVDPASGNITIDGIDISTISHDALRSSLVALPQEPYSAFCRLLA